MKYKLIVTIVNSGYSTTVMDAAREAGATGGTVIHSSGAGAHKAEKLFGIAVSPEKEEISERTTRVASPYYSVFCCACKGGEHSFCQGKFDFYR